MATIHVPRKKEPLPVEERAAYTLAEFAGQFGKHRSWAYKLKERGAIRTITGYGTILVPASEVERILEGRAAR